MGKASIRIRVLDEIPAETVEKLEMKELMSMVGSVWKPPCRNWNRKLLNEHSTKSHPAHGIHP